MYVSTEQMYASISHGYMLSKGWEKIGRKYPHASISAKQKGFDLWEAGEWPRTWLLNTATLGGTNLFQVREGWTIVPLDGGI